MDIPGAVYNGILEDALELGLRKFIKGGLNKQGYKPYAVI